MVCLGTSPPRSPDGNCLWSAALAANTNVRRLAASPLSKRVIERKKVLELRYGGRAGRRISDRCQICGENEINAVSSGSPEHICGQERPTAALLCFLWTVAYAPDVRTRIFFGNERHNFLAVLHLQALQKQDCVRVGICARVAVCVHWLRWLRARVRANACMGVCMAHWECALHINACMQTRAYLGLEFKPKSFKFRVEGL